jgi:hypothetical protein
MDRMMGTRTESLPHRLLRGGAAGLTGTLAMTPVIGIGAIGAWKPPSPAQITANVERKSGVDETPRDDPTFTLQWLTAHLSFGTGWGVAYALARPWLPASEVTAGLLWGGAIWLLNYGAILPMLGLYPSPADDRKGRMLAMIAAHAVYGVAVAKSARALA